MPNTQNNTPHNQKIFSEQIALIYEQLPISIFATVIVSLILTFYNLNVIDHVLQISWCGSLIVLSIIRFIIYKHYIDSPTKTTEVKKWSILALSGILLAGIIWGLSAVVTFPTESIVHQIFIAFILGGMVVGSIVTYSSVKWAFLAFSIPAFSPIIIRFLIINDEIHYLMGSMIILFLFIIIFSANKIHRMTYNSLVLRYENEKLVNHLSNAKKNLEQTNEQLRSEIQQKEKFESELETQKQKLEIMVEKRTEKLEITNKELHDEISERKEVEKALRESKEKYRQLVENANDAIFILQDEVIRFCNQKTIDMLGYYETELKEMTFFDLVHPQDRDTVYERYRNRIKGKVIDNTHTFRIISRSKRILWVQLNAVFSPWDDEPATLNFLRDITLQKRLEEQLQHAKKMEALVTLGGGIAHNFNNLLMGIQGLTSLMLMEIKPEHPHYPHLQKIQEIIESSQELTDELLGFAKGGKFSVRPTNVNHIIEKTTEMFQRTRKELRINTSLHENIWTVEVDRNQIEKVLINLLENAWHSMKKGGNVYIHSENIMLDNEFVKLYNKKPGNYVKISLTDTGEGLDRETQKRIFEPFFTTKELGRGEGLGLAAAYGIIDKHEGIIKVYSEDGIGTTFNIYLPSSEKDIIKEKKLFAEILKGNETILLVDDEELITNVGSKVLRKLGYKVIIARSGREAIVTYKEKQNEIDLIILDMIMPYMGGGETFDQLKKIDPDIKVLLSSGYDINSEVSTIMDHGCNDFIQKPFNIKALSQKIRKILSEN